MREGRCVPSMEDPVECHKRAIAMGKNRWVVIVSISYFIHHPFHLKRLYSFIAVRGGNVSPKWPPCCAERIRGGSTLYRALRDGRNTNPVPLTHLSLILRKKNPHWDRKSVDDHGSTSRALFTEKILMGNVDSCDEHCF